MLIKIKNFQDINMDIHMVRVMEMNMIMNISMTGK
jgi:hypothetical protein